MKKISMIASVALLFSGAMSHDKLDMDSVFGDGVGLSSVNQSRFAQQKSGNAENLLIALGQNPKELEEIRNNLGHANDWIDPSQVIIGKDHEGRDIYAPENLTQAEIETRNLKRLNSVGEFYLGKNSGYDSDEIALSVLKDDIKSLQGKQAVTQNFELRKKLGELLSLAQNASKQLDEAAMRDKVDAIIKDLKPSSGISLSDAESDVETNLGIANSARDQASRDVYMEVLKWLDTMKKEVEKLKEQSGGSLQDAIEKAKILLAAAEKNKLRDSSVAQPAVDFYTEIVAELILEDNAQENEQTKKDKEAAEIDRLVEQKIADVDHPFEALTIAKGELKILDAELKQLKDLRRSQSQISAKDLDIDKCIRSIELLNRRAIEMDSEIDSKLKKLLKEFGGNEFFALNQAKDRMKKHVQRKREKSHGARIDKGVLQKIRKIIKDIE